MSWIDLAKQLPCGQHSRCDCPQCGAGTNTNAAIYNHNPKYYSIYCNACDYKAYESKGVLSLEERKRIQDLNDDANKHTIGPIKLPTDTTYDPTEFSREARMWLFKGGLTPTVWRKYRIGYSKSLERVVLPVYGSRDNLIWYQCRAILTGQKPKYIQPSRDRNNIYYTTGDTGNTRRTIVVEDIMSAIRVGEAILERGFSATSLLGTKVTMGQADYLSTFEEVTTWLDGDRAGKKGSYAIRKTIGLLTECNNIRTELDPKCYSNKHILEIVS